MTRKTFTAEILEGRGGGAFVEIPFDVEAEYGTRGRVPVVATCAGEGYRGSVAPMGGRHVLGVTKAIRTAIGRGVGDTVRVTIERDDTPRTVTVPADLAAALGETASVARAFEARSYTHRKEFVRWVEEARKPETRARRIAQTVEMVREGRTR